MFKMAAEKSESGQLIKCILKCKRFRRVAWKCPEFKPEESTRVHPEAFLSIKMAASGHIEINPILDFE